MRLCIGLLLLLCARADRVVITFRNSSLAQEAARQEPLHGTTVTKQYGRRLVLSVGYEIPNELHVYYGGVEAIEPDLLVAVEQVESTSVDAASKEWQFAADEPYGMQVERLWPLTNGSSQTRIAVLDSGIAAIARQWFVNLDDGYDFISDRDYSLDGDGRDPDPEDTGGPSCGSWHGTKMAFAMAGKHGVLDGLHSVAWNTTVQPLRVLGVCSRGFANDVTDAVVWAAGGLIDGLGYNPTPAHIISMSFGGRGRCPSYLQSAITMAIRQYKVVILAAAGNDASDEENMFPGNCHGVVRVAASTQRGTLAFYSNRGPGVSLSAPGGDTLHPINTFDITGNESVTMAVNFGTSFSTAFAAGFVASQYDVLRDLALPTTGFNIHADRFTEIMCHVHRMCGSGILSAWHNLSAVQRGEWVGTNESWNGTVDSQAITVCLAGTYFTGTGTITAAQCTKCAAGTFSTVVGADSMANCTNCSAGTYALSGSSACSSCLAGTFATAVGATVCSVCAQGNICPGGNASSQCPGSTSSRTNISGEVCTVNNPCSHACENGVCPSADASWWAMYTCPGCSRTVEFQKPASALNMALLIRVMGTKTGTAYLSVTYKDLNNVYQPLVTYYNPHDCGGTTCFWYPNTWHYPPTIAQSIRLYFYLSTWSFGYQADIASIYPRGASTTSECSCLDTTKMLVGTNCTCSYGYLKNQDDTCRECPAGYFCTNSTASYPCLMGTYSLGKATVCVSCPLNYYSMSTASTSCTACPLYSSSPLQSTNISNCTCNAGYIRLANNTCRECLAGYYCPTSTSENQCTMGTYSLGKATVCVSCPQSYYSTSTTTMSCQACPLYTSSPLQSTTIANCTCNAGYMSLQNNTCRECLAGYYCPNSTTELNCSIGTYSLGRATVCVSCPQSYYSTSTTTMSCQACPLYTSSPLQSTTIANCTCNAGYTSLQNNTCRECVPGYYCPNTTSEIKCSAGTYSQGRASVCASCPSGQYNAMTGETTCYNCPADTSSTGVACVCLNARDATVINNACQCRPGYSLDDTISKAKNAQRKCGANMDSYCSAIGSSTYSSQYIAQYANDGNLNTQYISDYTYNNHWRVDMGTTRTDLRVKIYHRSDCCTNRINGYKLWIGSSTSYSLNTNCYTHVGDLGSTVEQTVTCLGSGRYLFIHLPAGNYLQIREVEIMTIEPCSVCESGKYSLGQYACANCSLGSYANKSGSSSCEVCMPGSYAYLSGSSTCAVCPTGKYANFSGSTLCTTCLPGAYSSASGSTLCNTCLPGAYSSASGSSTCAQCPTGKYANISSTLCTTCLPGTYSSGSTPCSTCLPGKYTNLTGASVCEDCASGSFSVTPTTCSRCPANTTSPAGSAGITDCRALAGYYAPPGSDAAACPANTTSPAGSAAITDCRALAGYYAPPGSDAAACPANTTSPAGSTDITDCRALAGYYGGYEASECPAYTTSPAGSTDIVNCTALDGYYGPPGSEATECPANTTSPAGSTDITDCRALAGYYGYWGYEASECPVNTMSPAGSTDITDCRALAGYYGYWGFEATECPANTTSLAGSTDITDCRALAGYYGYSGYQATECPANTTSLAGSTAITDCRALAGYYGPPGYQATQCPAKTASLAGSTAITDCRALAGYYGPPGYQATQCPAKTASLAGSTAITDCTALAGYYGPPGYEATQCPANTQSPMGSLAITQCTAISGYYGAAGTAATPCTPMCSNPGTYEQTSCSSSTNRVCSPCTNLVANASYTGTGTAASNCPWVCNAGFFLNGGICIGCLADSWCSGNILNACPANSGSAVLSSSQHQCLCKPGYFGSGSPCRICTSGDYCPGGNTVSCPANFTSDTGSDDIADCFCKPGYQLLSGTCQLCPPGGFCSSGSLSLCPLNSVSPTGSSAISQCKCDTGFLGPDGGTCTQCPANSYCLGGNTRQSCTSNAVSPVQSTNSSACYCDRGYRGTQNQPCSPCPAGAWCWTGVLNVCPTNTSSPPLSNDLLNCTCMPGFTGPDGQACSPCSPGTYKGTNGSDPCNFCPLNSTCPQGSEAPTPCPSDSYCDGIRAQPCPENTTSPALSTSISHCVAKAGYFGQPGSTPSACPVHTFSPVNSKKLSDCRCRAGFFCSYTQTIKGSLRAGIHPDAFNQQTLVDILAQRAGVGSSSVTITKITARGINTTYL